MIDGRLSTLDDIMYQAGNLTEVINDDVTNLSSIQLNIGTHWTVIASATGHVSVQSCLLIIFQNQLISLQYSWLSVGSRPNFDWLLYRYWEFPIHMKIFPMLICPIIQDEYSDRVILFTGCHFKLLASVVEKAIYIGSSIKARFSINIVMTPSLSKSTCILMELSPQFMTSWIVDM